MEDTRNINFPPQHQERMPGIKKILCTEALNCGSLDKSSNKFNCKLCLMERAAQADEMAPAHVFPTAADSAYFPGSIIHSGREEILNEYRILISGNKYL